RFLRGKLGTQIFDCPSSPSRKRLLMCTIGALVRFLGFAALIGLSLSILGASTAASADSVSAEGKPDYDGSARRNKLNLKVCSARAPLFGLPFLTFCGFPCRTRTILIRI